MKYFYEEITQLTLVTKETFGQDADQADVEEIIEVVKSTVHHKVLDEILSQLDEKTKEEFYHILNKDTSHQSTIEKLKAYIENIEEKVIAIVKKTEQEVYDLITK